MTMPMIRVADLVAQLMVDHGITDVFMLTGGGAMQLNDALGRHHGLRKIFTHHEQSAAMAAESYCRLSGRPALVNVTTGPGGVNALNGVYGAYVDSIAMVVVSGQVKRETIASRYPIALRQLGDQEVDIIAMARPVTKYAVLLDDPAKTRKVVEKALYLCRRGRPGPVWVDIPIDVQGALVDPGALEGFDPADPDDDGEAANTSAELGLLEGAALEAEARAVLAELSVARRPVILAGAGVRISGQHDRFLRFIERLGAPVVTGWNAHDALYEAHPLYAGRPGSVGDRAGNFAVQAADYVLVLGSRLNIRQLSYNWTSFAQNARVTMVDVDKAELEKPTLKLHRPIHADLGAFLAACEREPDPPVDHAAARARFVKWCHERRMRFPVVLPEYRAAERPVNPYVFGEALFARLAEDEIIISANGTACVTAFQCATLKPGQRFYTNSGCASMGYDLPAAIGAHHASQARRIICLAGDGSIMMNLQELQTIVGQGIPAKIFLYNNAGYHSIRQAQQAHFAGYSVGCGPDSGVTFPDFGAIARAFGLAYTSASEHADLDRAIAETLNAPGAAFCEIFIDKAQSFAPKASSRRLEDGSMVTAPLHDLAPFLPRDELADAMRVSQ